MKRLPVCVCVPVPSLTLWPVLESASHGSAGKAMATAMLSPAPRCGPRKGGKGYSSYTASLPPTHPTHTRGAATSPHVASTVGPIPSREDSGFSSAGLEPDGPRSPRICYHHHGPTLSPSREDLDFSGAGLGLETGIRVVPAQPNPSSSPYHPHKGPRTG